MTPSNADLERAANEIAESKKHHSMRCPDCGSHLVVIDQELRLVRRADSTEGESLE